jgi:hypothetical protein
MLHFGKCLDRHFETSTFPWERLDFSKISSVSVTLNDNQTGAEKSYVVVGSRSWLRRTGLLSSASAS